MVTRVADTIDSDKTPLGSCASCASPVDISGHTAASAYIRRIENERSEADDLIVKMLFVLEPFAAMANRYGSGHPDSTVVMTWQNQPVVTLGDLRRAKYYVDLY